MTGIQVVDAVPQKDKKTDSEDTSGMSVLAVGDLAGTVSNPTLPQPVINVFG